MTEEEILKFWQEKEIFKKSLRRAQDKPLNKEAPKGDYVFYDGPPFATGTPHYGHIVASVIKDAVPRYWTMKGYRVERKWGWDCHGLPIENIAEKELGIKRKKEIEEMGVGKFNEFCRSKVLGYVDEWKKVISRLGRWADMEDSYKTMDLSFMESVWWVFKQLWEKGLIYEGYRSMHICTRCETTLSQQEVAEGYKDIKDLSATVKFELVDEPGTFVLAWTTTPWTLIGNVALAINESIKYQVVSIKGEDNKYIIAKDRIGDVLKDKEFEIVKEIKGKDLVGKKYKPLFDYYEGDCKIYPADFVTTDEGTGVVHIAPAFGEDDFKLMEKYKLPFIQHVGMDGIIKPEAKDFAGMSVKPQDDHQKTDVEVIKNLAHRGFLFTKEKYEHSYPHCWRCETPLINYATSSWFVNITKIKGRALKLAKDINWSPSHIKEGRFGKWLEGARDWSISRQRYWASAIPIWKCEKCKEVKVVGSVDEIRNNIETPKNTYFVMRHGWAESNGENWVSARLETSHKYPLTKKGKEEVLLSAEKLKDKKIDLIFYSEFERTKETAFLVAEKIGLSADKIIPDRRIIEMNVGDFEGGPVDDYHKYFNSLEEKFYKNPPNGDNLNELKKRVGDFIYEIDAKYKNKKILIISHEYPIWMIFAVADGLNEKQAVEIKKGNNDFIKTSEIKEINFIPLPHNQNYELDLHRPYIDEVEFDCECGGKMRRIQDVLDTWFDSGSMPYAQVYYPFENKEKFEENFPAEFIAEGVDQTRAWFYYLHCIATAINDSRAFNNVIVNGIVLAEDGKKMAKRLQNYPDPINVMEKYGADALRFYLLSSPVVKAENLSFSEKGVDEAHKKVIMRLKNVLAFYKMYVLNSNLKNKISNLHNENILDKWILTRLNQLTGEITKAMDKYELSEAVRPIGDFVEDLSNWYVRRSRERFKNEDNDKNNATATLHHVLIELSKLIAPFMPFVAEEIYQELKGSGESVHLDEWPKGEKIKKEDEKLLEEMKKTRDVISVALEERARAGISVRKPLAIFGTATVLDGEFLLLIKDEINVKEIKTGQKENKLDTNITPELKNEGMTRELIRAIQDLRKKAGLNPQDKISLGMETDEAGGKFIKNFENEIKKGTNTNEIKFAKSEGEEIKVDELKFKIEIKK